MIIVDDQRIIIIIINPAKHHRIESKAFAQKSGFRSKAPSVGLGVPMWTGTGGFPCRPGPGGPMWTGTGGSDVDRGRSVETGCAPNDSDVLKPVSSAISNNDYYNNDYLAIMTTWQ